MPPSQPEHHEGEDGQERGQDEGEGPGPDEGREQRGGDEGYVKGPWKAQRRDDVRVGGHAIVLAGENPPRGAAPPNRRCTASGEVLKDELDWFRAGAPGSDELRRARLGDSGAEKVINAFLILVQFTDERHGYTPPGAGSS